MKKFSIILAIAGILLFVIPQFFYHNTVNAVDSGGSKEIVSYPNGQWTNKLPIFFGAVLVGLGAVFFVASGTKKETKLRSV